MTLALAGLLVLGPLWAWHIGAGWPPSLRDNAIKTVALASVVMLALACWPLAILWAVALVHWRDPDDARQPDLQPPIAGVIVIGMVISLFLLAAQVPAYDLGWVRGAILIGGGSQLVILGWQATVLYRSRHRGHTYHFWRDSLRGSMGNRVVTGGFLAFCFALAPPVLLPVFGLGVLVTNSFTALAASTVALALRYPAWLLYWGPLVPVTAVVCWHWRGHPRDSITGRRAIWRLLWHSWLADDWRGRLLGHGHWIFARRARWWHAQGLIRDIYSQAHQDALQCLIEYGAVGLGAIMILLALLTRGMAVGDPWTAALAAGLVVSLNQFTLHLPHTGFPVVVAAGVLWARIG